MSQDPSIPSFVVDSEHQIEITISQTDAQVADQGYSYNQVGLTYNQAGVQYGGLYNQNQDVSPEFFDDTVTLLTPSISSIIDVGIFEGGLSGMLIGIMGLTYP